MLFAACAATLCNVAFGYDVGVVSGSLTVRAAAASPMRARSRPPQAISNTTDLGTVEKEVVTSGLNFVAGFGALLLAGPLLDVLGRRGALLLSAACLTAGGGLVLSATGFAQLVAGRALQGLGSGCSWCACSVYITEIAPAHLRGALVSLADISINLGILLGYIIDYGVHKAYPDDGSAHDMNWHWRVAMGLSLVWPLLFAMCYPFIPESPRYLVLAGRDAEAEACLLRLEPDGDSAAAVRRMKSSLLAKSGQGSLCGNSAPLQRTIYIALAMGLAQQLTGTEAILYYTPTLFKQLHFTSIDKIFLANMGVGSAKFLGELVAAYLAERAGRRPMLIWGNLALCVSIAAIALSIMLELGSTALVLSLSATMLTFSLGPGPFTFVVVNEMTPLDLRGRITAASCFLNRMGSGTIALTFLSWSEATSPQAVFFSYAGIGVAVTVFYAAFVEEQSGKSLEGGDEGDEAEA